MTPDFVERKRLALMTHESQAELIKPFMLAFCRSSEMFFQEDQFEAIPDRGGLLVANPRGTWRRRVVRNSAPLIGARFGRGQDVDFAEVMVKDVALPHDAVLEISLHVLDDPVRHYQWTTGALAPGAAVTRGRGVMTLSWPQGWIGTSRLVVVGVQLWSSGKCEGKIPFRPLKWPMAGSG
jgi:hypothetical protein